MTQNGNNLGVIDKIDKKKKDQLIQKQISVKLYVSVDHIVNTEILTCHFTLGQI